MANETELKLKPFQQSGKCSLCGAEKKEMFVVHFEGAKGFDTLCDKDFLKLCRREVRQLEPRAAAQVPAAQPSNNVAVKA